MDADYPKPPRQAGYDAVWAYIRDEHTAHLDAIGYAVLWHAVEAFGDAMGLPGGNGTDA